MPIELEADGLAMDSHNGYLSTSECTIATKLNKIIKEMVTEVEQGVSDNSLLEHQAAAKIEASGFQCDYIVICITAYLSEPDEGGKQLAILVAAWLGKARLIDNRMVNLD